MLLFVVFCLNQFAKRSAFAGSMYGYTAKGLGPSAGVISGWTLIWSYFFIAVAGLSGFAIFCAQLLSALGYHGSVHPIFFFAVSAVVLVHRLQGHPGLLAADPGVRGASVACITALACVILFKHGFTSTRPAVAERGERARHRPGRRDLHLLSGRVRGRHDMGSEAKNPLKNLPRAVIASLLITGAFMVFMGYVEVFGPQPLLARLDPAPLNSCPRPTG